MKVLFAICFLFLHGILNSQTKFTGIWQGILIKDGAKESESTIFYATFNSDGVILSGKTREEAYTTEYYAVQNLKGTISDKKIEFKQTVVTNKKASSKITWCSSEFKGEYNDSSGYIKGTFKSSTCKRYQGTFILFRSKASFSESES